MKADVTLWGVVFQVEYHIHTHEEPNETCEGSREWVEVESMSHRGKRFDDEFVAVVQDEVSDAVFNHHKHHWGVL